MEIRDWMYENIKYIVTCQGDGVSSENHLDQPTNNS